MTGALWPTPATQGKFVPMLVWFNPGLVQCWVDANFKRNFPAVFSEILYEGFLTFKMNGHVKIQKLKHWVKL